MAGIVIKNAQSWFNGLQINSYINTVQLSQATKMLEDNTLGNSDYWEHSQDTGIKTASWAQSGFWNEVPDAEFFTDVSGADVVLSACHGDGAVGDVAYTMLAQLASYAQKHARGEFIGFDISGSARNSPLVRGVVLANDTVTATGNGTGVNHGAVASGQKLFAALHVTGVSAGDSIDVTIESDDNAGFTTPTTRMTFSTKSDIGAEWLTPISGPITDTYWRAVHTLTGASISIDFAVVLGIL